MAEMYDLVRIRTKGMWDALTEEDIDHIVGTVIIGVTVRIDRKVLVERLRGRYGHDRVRDQDVDHFINGLATLPGQSGTDDSEFPKGKPTLPGMTTTLPGESGTDDSEFPEGKPKSSK